jgi:hypothetical protein
VPVYQALDPEFNPPVPLKTYPPCSLEGFEGGAKRAWLESKDFRSALWQKVSTSYCQPWTHPHTCSNTETQAHIHLHMCTHAYRDTGTPASVHICTHTDTNQSHQVPCFLNRWCAQVPSLPLSSKSLSTGPGEGHEWPVL